MSIPTDTEIVIIGSGAAGSLMAARLAEAGHQVTILEAGPERRLSDLISSQLWSRRLKLLAPEIRSGGDAPLSVGFGSGWGTGGAAMHHYACWFRLHEDDFQVRSRFDKGLDWPIAYSDLRPAYDAVQSELGLAGDAEQEVWRPPGAPYPMPALPVFAQGRLIARGFERLGQRTAPLPMAINSIPYNGRPPCINDGWCDAGCPTGALANPLAVYLPRAMAAGATLHHDARALRVLTNPAGDRATGVQYLSPSGELATVQAKTVVLASYVFEIPRILFNSRPGGLANSSGMLGRYMTAHTTSNIFGLFDEATENYLGRTGGQLVSQDDYAKDPGRGFIGSSSWLIGNALKPNDLLGIANSRPDLLGQDLHAFMQEAAQHLATMTFVGESLASADNRITLGDATDATGLPVAQAMHSYDEDAIACWESGIAHGEAIMRAAGAREVWSGGRNQMHAMGGTVMGTDSRTSVTDASGRTHDVENLYIGGSSLFPSAGGVNPTFTISALAHRTADHIMMTAS